MKDDERERGRERERVWQRERERLCGRERYREGEREINWEKSVKERVTSDEKKIFSKVVLFECTQFCLQTCIVSKTKPFLNYH